MTAHPGDEERLRELARKAWEHIPCDDSFCGGMSRGCKACAADLEHLLALARSAYAMGRESAAAVCDERAKMWRASNVTPPKSTRARASEAESIAAAIREAGRG